ncbi:MAG: hypothetical protein IT423_10040 [Pirellulaceae bacterium]|nr:hypothetical protein [Pirellulaceae bacterium]
MADTTESFQGILQGQSIKLDRPPSLPDGSKVNVTVRKAKLSASERADKLKELFGGCAEDASDLDRYMDWNHQQRRLNRRGEGA